MKKKARRIIIITGTPGVGKTSVATRLASKLNATSINLGELVKKERLTLGTDKARGTLVADLEKVSGRVGNIITKAEGDVVVDGHYAVDVVSARKVTRAFVLRRNPEELKRYMVSRGWSSAKVSENLACEVLDVCLYDAAKACGRGKVCEVDVTGKGVEAVVDEIMLVLEDKKKCWIGVVDWLGSLERKGRLGEFLDNF